MSSIAILIGNSNYAHQSMLECCQRDIEAMKALMQATGRFERIDAHNDLDADAMKEVVRNALPLDENLEEIFFFFSGHGDYKASDFFFCGTGYDQKNPNLTGVSHTDLHTLFRASEPTTLVTVIDACFSGAQLIKTSQRPMPPVNKAGFRNVLQFSSSMDSQTSMAGDPLSEFTRAFLEASVRKSEGAVFYTDIAGALRDAFMGNDDQTPFFINQGTGREMLVEDVDRLASFKEQLRHEFRPLCDEDDDIDVDQETSGTHEVTAPRTPKELLEEAEVNMGSPEQANHLINSIFDGLIESFNMSEFAEFFETKVVHHSHYREPTIKNFMIRVLAKENRPDRLVTAEIKNVKKKRGPFDGIDSNVLYFMSQLNDDFDQHFNLDLNCSLEKAQVRLTLTPKFRSLQQLVLVLGCAPSLHKLYVFEMLTRHLRTDWDTFDTDGDEVVRRWYNVGWDDNITWLIDKICDTLTDTIRMHIATSVESLPDD